MEKQKKQVENGEAINNTSKSNGEYRQSLSRPHERTGDEEEEEDVEVVAETKEQQETAETDLTPIVDSVFGQVRMHHVYMYAHISTHKRITCILSKYDLRKIKHVFLVRKEQQQQNHSMACMTFSLLVSDITLH